MNNRIKHNNKQLSNIIKEMSGIIFNKINKNDYEFTKNQVKSYLQLNNDSKEEF